MPKLRKKVAADFTVIHNRMIRDYNLGATERGVPLTMLSLPEDWNFSIKGLSKILPDGVTKISTALKNLEKHHYLIRKRIYCDGKISDWDYIFSDEPMGEQDTEQQDAEKLDSENLNQALQDVEKPSNNKILNNQELNNQELKDKNMIDMIDRTQPSASKSAPQMQEIKQYTEIVKENIEYDYLLSQYHPDELDEVVAVMVDAITSSADVIRIGGRYIATETVKSRLLKLNSEHIGYVFDSLDSTTSNIKNMKSYLLTTLYNASMTMSTHIGAMVRHDIPSCVKNASYTKTNSKHRKRKKDIVNESPNADAYRSLVYNMDE